MLVQSIRNLELKCEYSCSSFCSIVAKSSQPLQQCFGKKCGKICGKIERLLDWYKNLCDSRYGPHEYDGGDRKTKRQNIKKAKRLKD